MNAQIRKSMHGPLVTGGIATMVFVFSTVAMTMVPGSGSVPGSFEGVGGIFAQEELPETPVAELPVARSGAGGARLRARCDECGVIESTRRVAPVGNLPAIYEITVRLRNGSTHVLSDASQPTWRIGERTILIAGVDRSGR